MQIQLPGLSLLGSQRQHSRASRRSAVVPPQAAAGDVVGLLVFSAIPFLAVQALADSKFGKQLLDDLQANKPALEAEAAAIERQRQAERSESPWFGPDRPLWLGPLSRDSPTWLDGTLPGDYGWDPLSLGKDPEALDRYVELELLHARWAMLGALGALIPEALQLAGTSEFLEPIWWKVGAAKLNSQEDLNYLGISGLKVAGGQGVVIIAVCQFLLMFGPGRIITLKYLFQFQINFAIFSRKEVIQKAIPKIYVFIIFIHFFICRVCTRLWN